MTNFKFFFSHFHKKVNGIDFKSFYWNALCMVKEIVFLQVVKFFCFLLFEATFISFFKNKKSKRNHKTVGIKVFLTYFACLKKDPEPDPYLVIMDPYPDPGGSKIYGSGSAPLVGRYLNSKFCCFRRLRANNTAPTLFAELAEYLNHFHSNP
jgi:hypothetical protein